MFPINREECLQRGLSYHSERVEGLLGDLKSLESLQYARGSLQSLLSLSS